MSMIYTEVSITWKKTCYNLREHAFEINNFKQKNIKPLTNEQQKSYQNVEICYFCKGKFEDKHD